MVSNYGPQAGGVLDGLVGTTGWRFIGGDMSCKVVCRIDWRRLLGAGMGLVIRHHHPSLLSLSPHSSRTSLTGPFGGCRWPVMMVMLMLGMATVTVKLMSWHGRHNRV